MKIIFIYCLFTFVYVRHIFSLEIEPWLHAPWNFHSGADLSASIFSSVENGFNPTDYDSNNILTNVYLIVPFTQNMDIGGDVQFQRSSKKSFGLESFSFDFRKQLLNDITGDLVSFTIGSNFRYVCNDRLKDVAVPYHNIFNLEIFCSIGKEFTKEFEWYLKTFAFFDIGQANKGYPWFNGIFSIAQKFHHNSVFTVMLDYYVGFGLNKSIDIGQFNGYANISHKSLDISVSYSYLFDLWGSLSLMYLYRPYARSFPEYLNKIQLSYDLPFSF